jgi:hypothetical protein
MYSIIMTKKIIPEKTSDFLKDLIFEIPLDQRKRLVKSKTYREGWLDCTMFWKIQSIKPLNKGKVKSKKIVPSYQMTQMNVLN